MPIPALSARAFFRDPLGYVESEANGDAVVRFAAGRRRYVLVRDPDAIWRVLVSDGASYAQGKWKRRARRFLGDTLNTLHGPEHRERRRLLQPGLSRPRVARAAPSFAERADRMQQRWTDGAELELRAELDPLALAMAGDVLVSTDLEPQAERLAAALGEVMSAVPRLTPPVRGTSSGRALAEVDAAIAALVAARRGARTPGDDLLGALVGSGLPARTVRGELLAFLLAAVDEPPSGLEAAWWLLGRHPEAERRLHAELDAVLGGRAPRPEDAGRLLWLDAVLRETLRLFPPARHIDRCPVSDVTIAGERVRAGTNVLVSPFVTHHDERLHGDAATFAPERWLDAAAPRTGRGSYVPFGAGVHTCIGEALARSIMTLTLASVARRWRLLVDPEAPAPVPRAPRLRVRLEAR